MFTPTKEQLEALGFEKDMYGVFFNKDIRAYSDDKLNSNISIYFISNKFSLSFGVGDTRTRRIYPQSIEDIQTLIRILSHNN